MWVQRCKTLTVILLVSALAAASVIPIGAAEAFVAEETIVATEAVDESDLAETGRDIEVAETGADDPAVTQVLTVSGGHKIVWSSYPGAAKYRLFVKNTAESGKSWIAVGDTSGLYLDHKNLTSGTTYTYTIRALNQKGQYISGFDLSGWDRLYLDAPAIQSVKAVEQGICLIWNEVDGAAKYRVYRKDFGGAWEVIGDCKSALYIDTAAQENILYAYTVRCVGTDNKLASFYINESRYCISGEPANPAL